MPQKTKDQLTETAQNLFRLLESQCMNIIILENAAQFVEVFSYIFTKNCLIHTKGIKF